MNIEERIHLYKGDCIEEMKKITDGSVDFIITDPPYNLGNFMRDRQTNLKKMRENFFGAAGWDDLEFDEWTSHMDEFFHEASRILKKKGAMVVFMSLIKIETLIRISEKYNFYYKTTGIWHKTNPMPRNMNLHFVNSVEGWVYLINKSKTGTFNNAGRVLHDFFETSVSPGSEKHFGKHPTQKPESLFTHFVDVLTNEDEVVCDPFMGSGTAGVVSKRLNRKFIGIELNSKYFELSKKRIDACQVKKLQVPTLRPPLAQER